MRTDRLGIVRPLYRRLTRWLAVRRNVTCGANFKVGLGSFINAADGLRIGDDVTIGVRCWISCNGSIGDGVLISSHVAIASRHEHETAEVGIPMSRAATLGDPGTRARDAGDAITIGRDVWIGFGAVLLSGVEIGRGAVVAAGAVVTRDVPAYTIVAGNPARPVGARMTEDQRLDHDLMLDARYAGSGHH